MVLLSLLTALAVPPQDDDAKRFGDLILEMQEAGEQLTGATYTLHSREYVDGSLVPESVMSIKFRGDDVYLEYVGEKHNGRKVLYGGPDWNGGKLRVDPGAFIPVMNLAIHGRMAMRGNRHSIDEVPVNLLVEKIVRDALKVNDHPTWVPEITDLGTETFHGEVGHCFDTKSPKDEDPDFYAYRVKICINPKTSLPNHLTVWDKEDGELRIVEKYDYIALDPSASLTDKDFAPETYGL